MAVFAYKDVFELLSSVASGDCILTRHDAAGVRQYLSELHLEVKEQRARLNALDVAIGRPSSRKDL